MNKKFLLLGLTILIVIFVSGCLSMIPTIGLASVEEIEILILESYPVQIKVIARGSLPDPCTKIYQISQERKGDTFFITITNYRPSGFCIQLITAFKKVFDLEAYTLPPGVYTINVNGVIDTFEL